MRRELYAPSSQIPVGMLARDTSVFGRIDTAGDFNAARIAYGDDAAGGVVGRDASPAFTSIAAYDEYFASADNRACNERRVGVTYRRLQR